LKIAKKHDKWIGLSTRPWMLTRLSKASFFRERFDKVVSELSDVYAILRTREHPEEKVIWEPPSEFNRCTTKYWVKPEDVLPVKCELIKHIPVLIFGRKLTVGAAGGANQPSDSSLVTSVYLDNDTSDIYHSRLDRLDNATLFRFRWYGPRAGPTQAVYVERKTHRGPEKKKAGLLSTKERFRVEWSDISCLLAGELDLSKRVEAPLRKDGAKEEDISYAMNLASECQQEIVARQLHPVSTTVYYRTSFQLSSSNAVRSTLDCQLRMVDESRPGESLSPDEWYRPLTGELNKDVHEFPYSVLEIKLQGDAPAWVRALIASGKLIECYKFSKVGLLRSAAGHATVLSLTPIFAQYLHSIVVLGFPVHKSPHWFSEDKGASFLLLPLGRVGGSTTSSSGPPSVAGGAPLTSPSLTADAEETESQSISGSDRCPSSMEGAPGSGASTDEGKTEKDKKAKKGEKQRDKKEKEKKEKEKEHDKGKDKEPSSGEPLVAKTLVRKRVDPKTLFANERTMLQWLNMAVLLVFTSLALLAASTAITNNGAASSNYKAVAGGAQLCGAILAPAAIMVMLYAMWQYYWRINRITDPDEDARFEDKFGPLFLVFMIIVVCSVAILISINRFSWERFAVTPHNDKAQTPLASHQAQAEPLQLGGPRGSLMLRQTSSGLRLGVLPWVVAAFVCLSAAAIVTSQSPGFTAFRQHMWGQLLGSHAGTHEGEPLLGGSKKDDGWVAGDAGGSAAGSYGSAEVSGVVAWQPAEPPPDVAITISGDHVCRRLPHVGAEQQRWDQIVATVLPEERRTRLHASNVPLNIV
jgi:uncharacterized membrane protein YidH (DUF202 family)